MQIKYIKYILFLLAAAFLTACSQEKPVETETETTVTTTVITEPNHILLRPFTIDEAFEEIMVGGEKFSFPIHVDELEARGLRYEDRVLYFPDGSTAEAYAENDHVCMIRFTKGVSPEDFSLMGLTYGEPFDVIYDVGIPDERQDEGNSIMIWYTGKGGQYFMLEFIDRTLTSITIEEH